MNSAWHGNEDIMAEKVDYGTLKKGGFMRQKQKNNFSLRLAVVGGYLTAENLTKIAEVAEKYGDGHVHLTSRQGVEIPFIKLKDIDAVKEELAEGGCRPGVCGPRVRTVTACQGNGLGNIIRALAHVHSPGGSDVKKGHRLSRVRFVQDGGKACQKAVIIGLCLPLPV